MRYRLIGFAFLLGLLVTKGNAYDFGGWNHDAGGYAITLELARETNNAMIVYFHIDDCGWCTRLEKEYFETRAVTRVLADMHKVVIKPARGKDKELSLAQQFSVQGYPTFLVVFPARRMEAMKLSPFVGKEFMSPDDFADRIKDTSRELVKKHVGRSLPPPTTSKPQGPPRAGTTADVSQKNLGSILILQGQVKLFEEYNDGLWLKIQDSHGNCWVKLLNDFYVYQAQQEYPMEVGSGVEVHGLVARDTTNKDIMLDATTLGKIGWSQRKPTPQEIQALESPLLQAHQLKGIHPGQWVPVQGTIRSITEEKDPRGLWIELSSGKAKVGVWLDGPILARMHWKPAVGQCLHVVGIFVEEDSTPEDELPLVGSLEVISPLYIQVVQEEPAR